MSNKNDGLIKELMLKVEEQKKALGNKARITWLTNGIFKGTTTFNINTVTEPTVLAEALSILICKEEYFITACNVLNIKNPKFKYEGYFVEEWLEDFKTRIAMLEYNAKKKVLDETQAKLSALVSEEARTEMALDEIKNLLK